MDEVYTVETDNTYPYNIYVGLQNHEVWKGPTNVWRGNFEQTGDHLQAPNEPNGWAMQIGNK